MRTIDQLCKPGSGQLSVGIASSATAAIEIFQNTPGLRLLAVLDQERKPVGAIFEEDIRQILFNPYGHALLRNPSFGRTLGGRVRRCPSIDVDADFGKLFGLYAQAGGEEGMIVTRDGRYHGVIENRDLIAAAGAYELDRLRQREAELDRLRQAGVAFEQDIAALSSALNAVAKDMGETASSTAERGRATEQHAGVVARTALQTEGTMQEVAVHSTALVAALDVLHDETAEARMVAQEAVAIVEGGARRADALYESTRSIETITALIDTLAGKVNMLAINATIEAARAGEAGRGFAVVAGEVKGLAAQTRLAAEDIRRHAVDVRDAVEQVVVGHDGIERVVAGVERISSTVETNVRAQRAMTREIAVGADQAACASQEIRWNVHVIHEAAQSAATGASEMERTALTLGSSARSLTGRVAAFLDELRLA
jgi:methyl-accepting chemotaxis protein